MQIKDLEHYHILEAMNKYYDSDASEFQRFGQFFVNNYLDGNVVWPELFYEEKLDIALKMLNTICNENFVDQWSD